MRSVQKIIATTVLVVAGAAMALGQADSRSTDALMAADVVVTNRGRFPIKQLEMATTPYEFTSDNNSQLQIEPYAKIVSREIAEVIRDKPFTFALKEEIGNVGYLKFYGFRFTFLDTATSKQFAYL
jgi:hypothetical protein